MRGTIKVANGEKCSGGKKVVRWKSAGGSGKTPGEKESNHKKVGETWAGIHERKRESSCLRRKRTGAHGGRASA